MAHGILCKHCGHLEVAHGMTKEEFVECYQSGVWPLHFSENGPTNRIYRIGRAVSSVQVVGGGGDPERLFDKNKPGNKHSLAKCKLFSPSRREEFELVV